MSNAIDFISAYNTIDARLRNIYRSKGNLQFSDLVRRCAEFNLTVRKYEDTLLLSAKLRNVIVHESRRDCVIAEPCDEITRTLCRVAQLLQSPPLLDELKEKAVTIIGADAPLCDAIRLISDTNYSNLPVYDNKRMVGVLNNRRIVRVIGKALEEGVSIDECMHIPCASVLHENDMIRSYRILALSDTVEKAIAAFDDNRKLLAVIVTKTGSPDEPIVNLLTGADLPMLIRMMEE